CPSQIGTALRIRIGNDDEVRMRDDDRARIRGPEETLNHSPRPGNGDNSLFSPVSSPRISAISPLIRFQSGAVRYYFLRNATFLPGCTRFLQRVSSPPLLGRVQPGSLLFGIA